MTIPLRAEPRSTPSGACDIFVKIGGSILDHEAETAALIPHITALARQYRILVLTGGGQAAKRIKANQRAIGTDFYQCWRAGVLCLEVNAHLLASYSQSFKVVASLSDLTQCFDRDRVGVFAPAGAILNSLHLLPDWEATTDSMGLHFSSAFGATRYVVVSDVDGIYEQRPAEGAAASPIPRLSLEELERLPSSKLDPAFSVYFRRYAVPTVVVNGRYPARVSAAISGDPTLGTEIVVSHRERAA